MATGTEPAVEVIDLDFRVDTARDGVGAVRVEHAPAARRGRVVNEIVEALIEVAERRGGEVDDLCRRRRLGDGQTLARSHA